MKTKLVSAIAVVLFSGVVATSASARDQISVVGSSTVYPFATVVAEQLGNRTNFKSPVIESTGSGGGFKIFCSGVGTVTPDFTNASRAIKQKEIDRCKSNGVTPVEYKVGYDGITISNSKTGHHFDLSKRDISLAVLAQVPVDGKWVPNPYKKWNEINPSLPNQRIDIMIPPVTSGTRDAFVELIMHDFCKKELKMDKKEYKARCTAVRTDGQYVVQMGENDNLIIQKLLDDDKRLGVFGFSFLDQNIDTVQGSRVEGVLPTFETIADGSYTVSRPLFFYAKKEHMEVIPGMKEYIDLFMSESMIGPEGKLSELGLIPLQ